MKKSVHYALLSGAALCFLAGVIVILVGYLRYLDAYESYHLEICQVVNRTTTPQQLRIQLRVLTVADPNYRKWFSVSSLSDYPLLAEMPCYVHSNVINVTVTVSDVQIEAYSDKLSLIIGLSLLGACLITLLTFIVISVIEKRRRRRYDGLEVPSDFRYQDSPIYHREIVDQNLNPEVVLQSFEEAQRLLWKNKDRMRENTFDRLRQDQIVAMMGEHSVKIKFQKDVYTIIKSLNDQS